MASMTLNPQLYRWAMTRVEKGLWASGEQLKGALRVTLSGQRHGRWYRVPGAKREYQASAPGEAPAVRLGDLKKRIASRLDRGAVESTVSVGTNVPYGKWLEEGTRSLKSGSGGLGAIGTAITEASAGFSGGGEFGNSGIAPRPWVRPTVASEWENMKRRFSQASGFLVK